MSHCDPKAVLCSSMIFSISILGACEQSSYDPPSGWKQTPATCSSVQHGPGDKKECVVQLKIILLLLFNMPVK